MVIVIVIIRWVKKAFMFTGLYSQTNQEKLGCKLSPNPKRKWRQLYWHPDPDCWRLYTQFALDNPGMLTYFAVGIRLWIMSTDFDVEGSRQTYSDSAANHPAHIIAQHSDLHAAPKNWTIIVVTTRWTKSPLSLEVNLSLSHWLLLLRSDQYFTR